MKTELDIYELGSVLKKVNDKYKIELTTKITLSGGWMTLNSEAEITRVPIKGSGCRSKSSNIIDILLKNKSGEGSVIKIIGDKEKKFNVDISSTRFKELAPQSITLNTIKINEEETKLRIDEDIILKIYCKKEKIQDIIKQMNN